MLIKNLKIQGFKSFYDEKELRFPKGMTAIVGPNGCGKSNIVDAIRWVLGEQSPKRLRGKKMDEVLFNGTEHFSPAGMARVCLNLARREKGFPHPYSGFEELCVERLLFRSGESEYRINRMPVRLRDVLDLFMDSGTGTQSFSIIEQGHVSEIVSAGPEKRRFFIEGAAGVVKFKARKESAARKMEATRENLRHVEAILSEISRQMNALNRQAQKARRYNRLKVEIRGLELTLASREMRSLLLEEQEEERKQEENRQRHVLLSTEAVAEEADVERIRSDLIRDQEAAEEMQRRLWGLVQEINQIENKQSYLKQSFEDLGSKIEENGKRSARVQDYLAVAECDKRDVVKRIGEISKRESWLQDMVVAARVRLETISSREKAVQERVEKTKDGLFSLMTRRSQFHNRLLSLQEKAKGLVQRKGRALQEIGELRREIEELSDERNRLEESLRIFKRNRGFLALERTALESFEKKLREEHADLSREEELLEGSLHQKRSRLYSLKELQDNYEGYKDGVRAVMKGIESQELGGGIRGMVADFIETEPEYEVALETVLGEQLQYVVVEEQQDGLQAIQYLKSRMLGRGSFIPLRLREGEQEDESPVDGAGVLLRDMVRVKAEYRDIGRHLLRDVVFVRELDDGLALWKRNGSSRRIVTQEGDIIDPSGVISGGKSKGTIGVVLRTRREIRELQKEVEVLESKWSGLREESELVLRKIRFNESEIDNLQQRSYGADMEILKGENDLLRVGEDLTRNSNRLEVIETENFEFEAELHVCAKEEVEVQGQEADLEHAITENENSLSRHVKELREWSTEKELCREELNESELEIHSVREKRTSLGMHLAETEKKIRSIEDDMRQIEEECRVAGDRRANIWTEMVGNEERITQSGRIRKEQEGDLVERNGALQGLTEAVKKKEEVIKRLRRELELLRQMGDETRLKLMEIGMRRENLQGQVWERHRVDIANETDWGIQLSDEGDDAIRENLQKLHESLGKIGEINPSAIDEFEELQKRHQFYAGQNEDLNRTLDTLQRLILKINRETRSRFLDALEGVNERFQQIFPVLFGGGKAFLQLEDERNPLESGVDIVAQPPGKKLQNINLLSGGEKTMTALSLILAIFQYRPSPFCVLDEVDAALDDMNVGRFNKILRETCTDSQFILITHNKQTMEVADSLFGITMESPGASQVVSVDMH